MNIAKQCLLSAVAWVVVSAPSHAQQLADTIWSGNAKVTIPALVACDENGKAMDYPKTTTGLTFIMPVEVWFWDSSKFLIVYRQRDMGADPARGALQPLIGEWTIPVAARQGLLNGISEVPYGSDLYEVRTGSYRKSGGKYFFTAEQRDTADLSGYDSEWIYPNAKTLFTGSFTVKNSTMSATLTAVSTPNPHGPGGIKTLGKNPSATVILTKTTKNPSSEGVGVFLDDPR